jgi:hypothetical protein
MLSVSIRLIVISIFISTKAHNAALSGEQRNTDATAYYLKH